MTLSPPPRFRGRLLTDLRVREAYSEGAGPFRIVPAAVAIPADRDDLAALTRHARSEGIPLIPRGAGSGMPGGNVGSGVVVDLGAFDRPARVALTQTANVGAAVTWEMVDRIGSHFGFRLPPDPSSGAFCTVGGMVATNAAGARSLRYGAVRPWVRGVEIVTADGECGWLGRSHAARHHRKSTGAARRQLVERLQVEDRFEAVRPAITALAQEIRQRFPMTTKNSAGYALDRYLASGDLVDLIVGSEGTLGFVTRVELQLDRTPPSAGTLLVTIPHLCELSDMVTALRELDTSAIELLDRTFLELVADRSPIPIGDAAAALIVEFEGSAERVVRDQLRAAERLVAPHALQARAGITRLEREMLWSLRHGASPALAALPSAHRSLQIVEDGCVPVSALSRYVEGVREAAAAAGVDVVAFGHAGDGHLHVNALVDAGLPDLERRLTILLESVSSLLLELGGTPSGEHGDGRLRAHLLERLYGPEVVNLFRRVKTAFDPDGVLNPGVKLENGGQPLANLKVGPNATTVSAAMEAALRHYERTAAWAQPRLAFLDSLP